MVIVEVSKIISIKVQFSVGLSVQQKTYGSLK